MPIKLGNVQIFYHIDTKQLHARTQARTRARWRIVIGRPPTPVTGGVCPQHGAVWHALWHERANSQQTWVIEACGKRPQHVDLMCCFDFPAVGLETRRNT
eukprot:4199555-Amphidinium_carterae.1